MWRTLLYRWTVVSIAVAAGHGLLADRAIGQGDDAFGLDGAEADAPPERPEGETGEEGGPEPEASADVADAIQRGDEALRQKRWRDALAAYMEGEPIVREPGADLKQALQIYIGITESYRGLKDYNAALRIAANALILSEQIGQAALAKENARYGEIMLKLGDDPEAAIERLRAASSLQPNDSEYLFQLGKGLADFARQQARDQVSDGATEMRDALLKLNAAAELRNDHADTYYERGTLNLVLGNVEYGISDLKRAVELDGEKSKYLAELGLTLQTRAARDAVDPEGVTDRIVQDYRDAIVHLTTYLEIEGPREAARKESQSREKDEDVPFELKDMLIVRARARSALAHELTGVEAEEQFRAAIEDCKKAAEQDPEDSFVRARAAYLTAISESMLGNLKGALVEFNRAIRVPQNALERTLEADGVPPTDALVRRGIVWYRLGDREMAFRDFQKGSEGSDPRASFWMGIVHAERGEFARAIDTYSDAIRLRPNYVAAYKNRGLAYLHAGLYRRAADDFEELIRRNPNDTEAFRLRASAFERLGMYDQASRTSPLAAN